ncbi:Uncharacterised protein [Segatella copri]|nr:Uncharacterised protein [Segatella copri]
MSNQRQTAVHAEEVEVGRCYQALRLSHILLFGILVHIRHTVDILHQEVAGMHHLPDILLVKTIDGIAAGCCHVITIHQIIDSN